MAFDLEGARQAGYSDDEIAGFLSKQQGFDLGAATQAGYKAGDVIGFLSERAAQQAGSPPLNPSVAASTPSGSASTVTVTPPSTKPGGATGSWEDAREGSWDDRSEARKGAESAVTGLKAMVPAAKIAGSGLVINRIGERLDSWDRIDRGERVPPAEGAGYQQADAVGRQKLREDLIAKAAQQKDFVGESIKLVRQYQQQALRDRGRTVDFTDIADAKGFADWLQFNGAAGAVYLAPVMLSAALGGPAGAGAVAYGLAAGEINSDRVAAAIDMNRPERFKNPDRQQEVDQAQGVAARVADTVPSTLAFALPNAALDVASGPVRNLITKPLHGLTKRETLRAAPGMIARDVVEEGVTGAAQEVGNIAAERYVGEQQGDVLTEANAKRVINAGAAEAAGGLVGGSGHAAVSLATAPVARTPEQAAAAVLAAPTVDEAIDAAAAEALTPIPTPAAPPTARAAPAPSPAARPEAAAAVDNIARILGQNPEMPNAGRAADVPALDPGSTGRGLPGAADGLGTGVGADGTRAPALVPGDAGDVATRGAVPPGAAAAADGAVEPQSTWFGRAGNGYATQEDAQAAMPSRQRARADLDWRIEPTPEGRFRLAGYAPIAAGSTVSAPKSVSENGNANSRFTPNSTAAAQPAAQGFSFTLNPSGTLTVQGDPQAIRSTLAAAGIDKMATSPSGVMVGVSQAQQAAQVLASVDSAPPVRQDAGNEAAPPPPIPPEVVASAGSGAARGDAVAARPDPIASAPPIQAVTSAQQQAPSPEGVSAPAAPLADPAGVVTVTTPEASRPSFTAVLNPTGTLTIKGDPEAIKAVLRNAGITGVRRADGVLVGTKQAQVAQRLPGITTDVAERGGDPFRTFLMRQGIALRLARDFAPGTRERLSMGNTFRNDGMELDALAERAAEQGFIKDRGDIDGLYDLITRAVSGERIGALYGQDGEGELQARIDRQRQLEQDAAQDLSALSDETLQALAEDPPAFIEGPALSGDRMAAAMRDMGFNEQEIADAVAQETSRAQGAGQGAGEPVEAAAGEAQGADRGRAGQARDEGLSAPSEQDVLDQQRRRDEGERTAAQRRIEENNRARADAQRDEFTLQGSDRAADANPAQRDAFDAPMRAFDHGELNIPGRTNRINADLDRYKAEQQRTQRTEAKQATAKRKTDKALAQELFGQLWPSMKEKMGPRFGEKQLRETLDSMVKWEPAKFIAMAEKFQREQGGKDAFDTVMRHRAFHGTPHDFDRFSTENIGTGEGAQAYGWGLYFAENRGVAESYQKTLAGDVRLNGKPINRMTEGPMQLFLVDMFKNRKLSGLSDEQAREQTIEWGKRPGSQTRQILGEAKIEEFVNGLSVNPGRLLEVHIPDEVVDRMLLWDKGLDEQPNSVKSALGRLTGAARELAFRADGELRSTRGSDFYEQLAEELANVRDERELDGAGPRGWGGFTQIMNDRVVDQRAASALLESIGIPGIRYLDGNSRNRPLKDIKREFLSQLPEDADFDEVLDMIGDGTFSPKNEAILRALAENDWLGFDYPAQAISAALSDRLANYDASDALVKAVEAAQQDGTHNLVVFNDKNVEITHKDGSPVTKKERDAFLDEARGRGLNESATGEDDGTGIGRAIRQDLEGVREPIREVESRQTRTDVRRVRDGRGVREDGEGSGNRATAGGLDRVRAVDSQRPGTVADPGSGDGQVLNRQGIGRRRSGPEAVAARRARSAEVRQWVDDISASWKDGPQIKVVETVADLPGENPADTRGLYRPGEVWIVANSPEHRTKAGVARTLAHEAVAHYGLRKMLGREAWNRLMRDIQLGIRAKNKPLLQLQAEVREAYVDEDGNFELSNDEEADEIAARAVEMAIDAEGNFRPGFSMFKAAFARVAQFLRGIFGDIVAFTNAELQGMLVLSMRGMEVGRRTAGGGRMVLGGSPAARSRENVLSTISKVDELFKLPKSGQDTIEGIAADNDPAIKVRRASGPLSTIYILTMPDGREARIYVRRPNPYGPQAYGLMDRGDGEMEAITERPGTNPEAVEPGIDDVYTDVSKLREGGAGSLVYNIAATFAHNTGRIFIGDPAGLSDVALRRRTEQMLSSALKFGTTRHLAPHPRQAEGDRKLGVPPLRWTYGDDIGNIKALIQTSLQAFDHAGGNPISFDIETGRFLDSDGGELDPGAIKALAGAGVGRNAHAGADTLRRNAILRALSEADGAAAAGSGGARGVADGSAVPPAGPGRRAASQGAGRAAPEGDAGAPAGVPGQGGARGQRLGLLEQLLDVAGQPGAPASGVFYARGGVANPSSAPADDAPASATSPWRDPTGRIQFAPGAWLYDKLGASAGPLLSKLQMKAASPKLRRALREMKLQVQKAQETAGAVATEAMKLTEDERDMVSGLIERELEAGTVPPAHAVRLAAMINSTMGAQTDELVRLGMLSEDSADRWRGQYLPRYYRHKLGKQVGDAWADAVQRLFGRTRAMAGIKGKHLRGRGLFETIPASEVAQWEDLGWEVRDPDFPAATGAEVSQRILAGEIAPEDQVQVWRDFTREERGSMGEIRDAGFRFVMGYMQTQRDVALGRLFEQLAGDPEISSKKETAEFTVRVPDGTVTGTGAKRYGMLAGRWVSKDTFSHLTQIEESQSEAWKMYRKALAIWKEGKVALNPVSHVNNMVSNLTMAHFAGVSYLRADKYIAAARDFAMKAEGVKEAKEAGLFLGTMSDAELMNVLPEDLKALVKQQDSAAAKIGSSAFNVMTFFLRRPMGWAYQAEDTYFRYLIYKDARARGLEPGDAVDYAQRYIFTYDDLPKGARMIRDFGIPFFAYTYKAVPALLHTALTHPVRMAAPAAVLWGINAAAYAIAAGDDDGDDWLEALEKYLRDADFREQVREKEKLEREHLPPWMKGSTSLGTPKAIRLGMDEVTKLPLFIDTSRIVPGGDLFDVQGNAGGIPWLQPITPSNPLLTTYMAMFGNKDAWFGKEIVDANDTRGEAAAKRAEWLWMQVSPAVAFGNYHFQRGMNALAQATGSEIRWMPESVAPDAVVTGIGRDGNPVQPKYAVAQTFGIKVRPIDLETSEAIEGSMQKKMIRDIDTELRKLLRLNRKGAISDSQYDRARDKAQEKKDRLRDGLTVDGDERE